MGKKTKNGVDQLMNICKFQKAKRSEYTYQSCLMDIFEIKEQCDSQDVAFEVEAVLLSLAGN